MDEKSCPTRKETQHWQTTHQLTHWNDTCTQKGKEHATYTRKNLLPIEGGEHLLNHYYHLKQHLDTIQTQNSISALWIGCLLAATLPHDATKNWEHKYSSGPTISYSKKRLLPIFLYKLSSFIYSLQWGISHNVISSLFNILQILLTAIKLVYNA